MVMDSNGMENTSFLIVVTGFNCQQYVDKCLRSLCDLNYTNFKVVVIDDASTDATNHRIRSFRPWPRVITNKTNMGAAYGRYMAINKYAQPNDVILLLGLDDELLPNALTVINEQYQQGKLMTYGNWVNQNGVGLPENFPLEFDEETHKNRDYRKVEYRSTAPNTFYAKLFFQIPEDDFKLNGKWIDSTTESELMLSCLEMCGKDRIGVIHEHIYMYNQCIPNGTIQRLGFQYKRDIYNKIIQRDKKPLFIETTKTEI